MIEFTVVQAAADPLAREHATRHHHNVKWCGLNDETVYWALPDRERPLPDELRLLGGPPQTAQGDLYLVVQVGNAFLSRILPRLLAREPSRSMRLRLSSTTCMRSRRPRPEKG